METKFLKFQNALPMIFDTHDVKLIHLDKEFLVVRSNCTCMICGCELLKLIALAQKNDLHFYVRSNILENGMDCVEFVIY